MLEGHLKCCQQGSLGFLNLFSVKLYPLGKLNCRPIIYLDTLSFVIYDPPAVQCVLVGAQ